MPEPKLAISDTETDAVLSMSRREIQMLRLSAPPLRTLRGFSVWSWGLGARCLCACALLEAELVLVSWNCQGAWDPLFLPTPTAWPWCQRGSPGREEPRRLQGKSLSASLWPGAGLGESQSAPGAGHGKAEPSVCTLSQVLKGRSVGASVQC